MTFLDCLNSPKCDFTQNRSGGKIIKFQQSQALTSHFESFCSIVACLDLGCCCILTTNQTKLVTLFHINTNFFHSAATCYEFGLSVYFGAFLFMSHLCHKNSFHQRIGFYAFVIMISWYVIITLICPIFCCYMGMIVYIYGSL